MLTILIRTSHFYNITIYHHRFAWFLFLTILASVMFCSSNYCAKFQKAVPIHEETQSSQKQSARMIRLIYLPRLPFDYNCHNDFMYSYRLLCMLLYQAHCLHVFREPSSYPVCAYIFKGAVQMGYFIRHPLSVHAHTVQLKTDKEWSL